MTTLLERIGAAAAASAADAGPADGSRPRGITFVTGGTEEHASWAELYADAARLAGGLADRGVGPGSHVALLGPTTRRHVTLIEAVWLAGATLVVLPLPMRLSSIDDFVERTRRRIRQADVVLTLVDPDLVPFVVPEPGDPPVCSYDDLATGVATVRPVDPASLAVIQFTSGSTDDPKGVMLPHRTVCANLDAIASSAGLRPATDVMVSWLPLYHDMGLVGFLMLPMTTGTSLVLGAPTDFLAAPARWMQWLSDHRGTVTAGPNFAWVLATRALRNAAGLDLSSVRVALNGAEPVDAAAVDAFVAAAAPHGFAPGAVFPAFGMAEVVIGATFPPVGRGMVVDHIDRVRLEHDHVAVPALPGGADQPVGRTRSFVRLGHPVPGLELRVVDPVTGAERAERAVGEVQLRGTSVTPGYYLRPDANAELFDGEWLRTGDLGYLVDGELVLCGRSKDVIIIGGRNIYPDEIERAVGTIDGVRNGNVIAFGIEGRGAKEAVAVVAEVRADDLALLRKHVVERVRDVCGVPPKVVAFAAPGTLPKTSSGKLQRSACCDRYLAGDYHSS
jgi:fatty-acyl-CoA synthase